MAWMKALQLISNKRIRKLESLYYHKEYLLAWGISRKRLQSFHLRQKRAIEGWATHRSINGMSTEYQRNINRISTECQRNINGISMEYQRNVNGMSTECEGSVNGMLIFCDRRQHNA
jgi:hypothetical protein